MFHNRALNYIVLSLILSLTLLWFIPAAWEIDLSELGAHITSKGFIRGFLVYLGSLKGTHLRSLSRALSFYMLFGTTLLWLLRLLPEKNTWHDVIQWGRTHAWLGALIGILVGLMFCVSPAAFRVQSDEANLLGIASTLFDKHGFSNTTQGLNYYHKFHEVKTVWGIRPIFYPFTIYIAHSLLGYSAYNGFVVNALCMALSLGLFYHLLQKWFGSLLALSGMLTLAAFPVVVLWTTSSGFEICNLMMALLAFTLLDRFLEFRKSVDIERLGLTLILLSQTRYESTIFAIVMFVVVVRAMSTANWASLSYVSYLLPWLFLPVIWQRLLKSSAKSYQVDEGGAVFSPTYFTKHVVSAFEYFATFKTRYPTISVIFYLALACGLWGIVSLIIKRKAGVKPKTLLLSIFVCSFIGLCVGTYCSWAKLVGTDDFFTLGLFLYSAFFLTGASGHGLWYSQHRELSFRTHWFVAAIVFSFLLLSMVVFSYHHGNLVAAWTVRLGVIFVPFVILFALVFVRRFIQELPSHWPWGRYLIMGNVALFLFFWPRAGLNESVRTLTLFRVHKTMLTYLERNFPDPNIVIINDRPGLYAVHRYGSVGFGYAKNNIDRLARELKRRLYQDILVYQHISYKTNEPEKSWKLDGRYQLETIFEGQYSGSAMFRLSKVTTILTKEEFGKRNKLNEQDALPDARATDASSGTNSQ
jgi:hypothetical protein